MNISAYTRDIIPTNFLRKEFFFQTTKFVKNFSYNLINKTKKE